MNNNLVLIAGKSATGKSLSLRNLKDPKGVIYLNCENNKALPFADKFRAKVNIEDPYDVYGAFTQAEGIDEINTIVIDSLTFLMEMFESKYVIKSDDGRQAWSDYAQYFINLMNDYVKPSTKDIIFTAHTLDVFNEKEMMMETLVKVKGSLMNMGIEARFTNVIATKKLSLPDLEPYTKDNDLLTISDRDKLLGFKYVFQTQPTEATRHERIRSPYEMWTIPETYVNNDIQLVLDRIHEFYS